MNFLENLHADRKTVEKWTHFLRHGFFNDSSFVK